MLDLGQTFIHPKWYELAPKAYAASIQKNEQNRKRG
jgi:hypothetical protein